MTVLGVHVVQGPRDKYGDFLKQLADAGKHVVVYALDDPAPLREAKEVLGDAAALTVLRYDKLRDADGEQQDLQGVNPERFGHDAAAAARHYMDRCLPVWEDHRDAADFFGTTNEWSNFSPFQHAFHAACMDIAEARGFKLALYAFSSGNPPEEFVGEDFVANCRRMKARGHVLSVHEYGLVESGRLRDGVPFHAQRVAHLYQAVLAPRAADPDCIVTEFAFGGGLYDPDTFLDNVRWYTENVLRRYSFIVGGTIFTLGNWQGGAANFQDKLIDLANYITSLPDAAPDDPLIQPPFVYPTVSQPPRAVERTASSFELGSPVRGIPFRITDPFDTPRPYANGKHEGIDIRCFDFVNNRAVEILAPADGTVVVARRDDTPERDYGNFVILKHRDGFFSLLAHLASMAVEAGQTVRRGDVLGVGGKTDADAIHLHLTLLHADGLTGYYTHPLSPVSRVLNPTPFFDPSLLEE